METYRVMWKISGFQQTMFVEASNKEEALDKCIHKLPAKATRKEIKVMRKKDYVNDGYAD